MNGEILTTGSELNLGQAVNSNAPFLCRELTALGISIVRQVTVGDDPEQMVEAVREALGRVPLVIVTGGLGPTGDDITREAVAEALSRPLRSDPEILKGIEERCASFGRTLEKPAQKQALFPEGARPLPNPLGTAPGFVLEWEGKILIALPGVPDEMKAIFTERVLPMLAGRVHSGRTYRVRKLYFFGLFESDMEKRIGLLLERGRNPLVGITARPGVISLTIRGEGESVEEADRIAAELEARIRDAVGEMYAGIGGESPEEEVALLLERKGATLAVAESCTGGLIAHSLTRIPGISRFFLEGVVAYSDRAKERLLGVPGELLRRHGGVSREAALAMVRGVVERSGANAGISVTGIAGPGGGTGEKPVGLVYIGIKCREEDDVHRFVFPGDRNRIQAFSASTALNLLRSKLISL